MTERTANGRTIGQHVYDRNARPREDLIPKQLKPLLAELDRLDVVRRAKESEVHQLTDRAASAAAEKEDRDRRAAAARAGKDPADVPSTVDELAAKAAAAHQAAQAAADAQAQVRRDLDDVRAPLTEDPKRAAEVAKLREEAAAALMAAADRVDAYLDADAAYRWLLGPGEGLSRIDHLPHGIQPGSVRQALAQLAATFTTD